MRSFSWLTSLKSTCGVRPVRWNRRLKNSRTLPRQSEQLEVRSFPSATVMQAATASAQTQWAAMTDEERFDQFAQELAEQVNQYSDDVALIGEALNDLPLSGDELAEALSSLASSAFKVELPESGIADYLHSHGFEVESLASANDLLEGTNADWIVLTYQASVESNSPVHLTGRVGSANGIHLDLNGELSAEPQLTLAVTFGLDHNGNFFLQEGSKATVALTVDGRLEGSAVIPNLVDVDVEASSSTGKHLVDARVDLIFSDFDSIANERLYLTGEGGLSITDMLKHEDAADWRGTLNLDAELSVDTPVNHLPEFLRRGLAGVLPTELSWNAGVTYDLVTQELTYSIEESSLTKIVEVFQKYDSIEDAVFQVMIDKISENNPIPAEIQKLLAYEVPILGQNLMDLMDIPEAMQFLITPEAFRDRGASTLETNADGDKLDFNLDLFTPENLRHMLSGETYDIFSVDVDQTFRKDLATITVMPETVLASYFGIVNVTAQVDLIPQMYFAMQMTMGLDSQGFYTLGEASDSSGNIIDKSADRNLEFGVGITGRVIAEGDLFLVLDLVRVTMDVGLTAKAGMTFVSPHENDLKLRGNEILKPANIHVSAGVDLHLGVKGEVGILDLKLQRTVEETQEIELYRHNAGTLADLQDKLTSFKEKFQEEGRQVIFIGAAAGEPHCLAAATVMLYQELRSYGPVVKTMVNDLHVQVTDVVKSLHKDLNAGWTEVAKALKDGLNSGYMEVANALKAAGAGFSDVANALKDGLNAGYMEIANALKDLNASFGEIVTEVSRQFTLGAKEVADMLSQLGASFTDIARLVGNKFSLNDAAQQLGRLGLEPEGIATALRDSLTGNLWKIAESLASVEGYNTKKVARGLRALTDDARDIADALEHRVTRDVGRIAGALTELRGFNTKRVAEGLRVVTGSVEDIASALKRYVTDNFDKIAEGLDHVGFSPKAVARGLGNLTRDIETIAGALRGITGRIDTIAEALYRGVSWADCGDAVRGLRVITRDANRISNALRNGANASANDIANALGRVGGLTNARSVVESLVGKKNLKKFGF